MKIIEGMKQLKKLQEKANDLRTKIGTYCADLNIETATYADQKSQVSEWLQAHSDVVKELLSLKFRLQKTNCSIPVTISLGGKPVTKMIAEWVFRRRELAKLELEAWNKLGDRGLREGKVQKTSGEQSDVTIRRYFDPKERDEKVALYRSEPHEIDGALEVVNAVTDLLE